MKIAISVCRALRTPAGRAVPDVPPSRARRACAAAAAAADAAAARRGRAAPARGSARCSLKPAADRAGKARAASLDLVRRREAEREPRGHRPPPPPGRRVSAGHERDPCRLGCSERLRASISPGSSSQRKYPPSGCVQDASAARARAPRAARRAAPGGARRHARHSASSRPRRRNSYAIAWVGKVGARYVLTARVLELPRQARPGARDTRRGGRARRSSRTTTSRGSARHREARGEKGCLRPAKRTSR